MKHLKKNNFYQNKTNPEVLFYCMDVEKCFSIGRLMTRQDRFESTEDYFILDQTEYEQWKEFTNNENIT